MVFLPLGLGFRGVPFLRKTGSTIIAAALVMYFVFPTTIWINQQVYAALNNPQHPVLQPWANYPDAIALCQRLPGEDQAAYVQRVQSVLAPQFVQGASGSGGAAAGPWKNDVLDYFYNTFFKPAGTGAPAAETDASGNVGLPVSQQRALAQSLDKNFNIIHQYVLNFGWILGPVLPTNYFFEALVDQISNSMQWFVLSMLFLVNTLIMSVTLFRDISLAIGGEPRIFGMSKLV
ncbi:MAG: hypothetical protein KGH63_02345, partial [Candidatus Micrarchaeota archaeon]|nr:hypothetical protein [Candidatus Micrarchaeota archaeon]